VDVRQDEPRVQETRGGGASGGFEVFFAAHHGRLFAAMCAVTGDRQEAEEIAQDAFLKIWERWDTVSGLKDPVGYLYRTAMNLFRKRYRRAKLALRKSVRVSDRSDVFEAVDARETVIRGLRDLTPPQRAAVVFTSLLGFSAEEASQIIGTTPESVRTLASKARAAMREVTGDQA
jgi:RNA polymerase sigma factor (sigma-70 family)